MEMDHILFNKLNYIDNHQTIIKTNNNKNIIKEQVNDFFFTNLKGKEYKLLKQSNKKFLIEFKTMKNYFKDDKELLNLAFFHQMQRKLNYLQLYINLVGLVFMLRYIDMIVKVKRGGTFSI